MKLIQALMLLSVFMLVACKEKQNLEDMHRWTNELNQNTGEMKKSTGDMEQTTQGMAATTSSMAVTTIQLKRISADMHGLMAGMKGTTDIFYAQGREAEARKIRVEAIAKMEHDEEIEKKIVQAAAYFKAFEFQLWASVEWDEYEKRRELFTTAMKEFFRTTETYLGSVYDKDDFDPSSNDQDMKNLYALAATMHEVNYFQKQLVEKNPKIKEYSVLDLIKKALRVHFMMNKGMTPMKEFDRDDYEYHVDFYRQKALYLLQLRQNFLVGMTLGKISNIAQKGTFGVHDGWTLGIGILSRKLGKLLGDWDPKLHKQPTSRIREVTKWMDESIKTYKFLSSICVKPKLDKKVKKVVKNMKVVVPTTWNERYRKGTSPHGEKVKLEAIAKFRKKVQTWIGLDKSYQNYFKNYCK